jgi:anthranilate phosphoribosyltransferase
MKTILNDLIEHKTLSYQKAKEVLTDIGQGKYSESEIAAFLVIFLMRSITVDELTGFRDALLDLCLKIDLSPYETVDLCGTGGDGKSTFNISTAASFVVAGTGRKVAKHGNYGVSSSCGSSNLLEYLGYKFTNNASILCQQIEVAGICFLHAPLFHPAMKNVAPVRRNLGIKTFFNMLGPMVNPSFPKNQLVGVYSLPLLRLYNYLYQQTENNYIIIHSLDGYDEVSLTDKVKVISKTGERILSAADFGMDMIKPQEIIGGASIAESAKIFMDLLNGNGTHTQNQVVIANAALALNSYNLNRSLMDCIEEAKESLFSGKALATLKKLIQL